MAKFLDNPEWYDANGVTSTGYDKASGAGKVLKSTSTSKPEWIDPATDLSVKYAATAGTAGTVSGTVAKATKADSATTATKLSASAGDSNTPVYFSSSGKPVACSAEMPHSIITGTVTIPAGGLDISDILTQNKLYALDVMIGTGLRYTFLIFYFSGGNYSTTCGGVTSGAASYELVIDGTKTLYLYSKNTSGTSSAISGIINSIVQIAGV